MRHHGQCHFCGFWVPKEKKMKQIRGRLCPLTKHMLQCRKSNFRVAAAQVRRREASFCGLWNTLPKMQIGLKTRRFLGFSFSFWIWRWKSNEGNNSKKVLNKLETKLIQQKTVWESAQSRNPFESSQPNNTQQCHCLPADSGTFFHKVSTLFESALANIDDWNGRSRFRQTFYQQKEAIFKLEFEFRHICHRTTRHPRHWLERSKFKCFPVHKVCGSAFPVKAPPSSRFIILSNSISLPTD